jgi:hypothetical protein
MWAPAVLVTAAQALDLPMAASERKIKVAFMYNFMRFTEWPESVGNTLTLCVRGPDPFGATLDTVEGKAVGTRTLTVQRRGNDSLTGCQAVFISAAAQGTQAQTLAELRGKPVLTIADSPGAARQGVNLNMAVAQSKVTFEANLQTARAAQLKLSSQLLRLATEVIQ